jgi:hypothetical protein
MDYGLYDAWLQAKQAEAEAIDTRRRIEDELTATLEIPETFEGSKTLTDGGYKLVLTGRMTRKVDAILVQNIATERGLENLLTSLFRWKPELDLKAWKATDASLTAPFEEAITTKPGRLSYKIEKVEGEAK